MKLKEVESNRFIFVCFQCGKRAQKVYANLDGKAFVEYYCQACVDKKPV